MPKQSRGLNASSWFAAQSFNGRIEVDKMHTLQISRAGQSWTPEGHKSGSVSELRDHATLQNTDYRIIDGDGVIVWEFSAKGGR